MINDVQIARFVFTEAADDVGRVQKQLGFPCAIYLLETPNAPSAVICVKVDAPQRWLIRAPE